MAQLASTAARTSPKAARGKTARRAAAPETTTDTGDMTETSEEGAGDGSEESSGTGEDGDEKQDGEDTEGAGSEEEGSEDGANGQIDTEGSE